MDIGISFKNLREGKGKSVYALSKETGVSENHIPVSYTHLDVYKRQVQPSTGSFHASAAPGISAW